MYNVFEVTDWGLRLDGKDIAPGSKILHKGSPNINWKSCGHQSGQTEEKKVFEVATPSFHEYEKIEQENEIRELYEQVLGKKPHHRMTLETIIKAIEDADNG